MRQTCNRTTHARICGPFAPLTHNPGERRAVGGPFARVTHNPGERRAVGGPFARVTLNPAALDGVWMGRPHQPESQATSSAANTGPSRQTRWGWPFDPRITQPRHAPTAQPMFCSIDT